jgi:hypothetical protein
MWRITRPRLVLLALAALLTVNALSRPTSSVEGQPPQALAKARELLVAVDSAELCHWRRHGRYGNLADVDEATDGSRFGGALMALASRERLAVDLQVSSDHRSYFQRITGRGVDTYVERRGSDFIDFGPDGWQRLATRCPAPAR